MTPEWEAQIRRDIDCGVGVTLAEGAALLRELDATREEKEAEVAKLKDDILTLQLTLQTSVVVGGRAMSEKRFLPVREDGGWGRLRMEPVPPYVPTAKEIDKALRSIAKAHPYLAEHAPHIDGEFDNALSNLRGMIAALLPTPEVGR